MRTYLQSYMDEFCWRYNHRGMKARFALLLEDVCRQPHHERPENAELFSVHPLAVAA